MNGQLHATLGIGVLVVNLACGLWALRVSRRGVKSAGALAGGVAVGLILLAAQTLVGLDLLGRGLRPASTGLTIIHVGGPVVALIVGAALLLRPGARASHHATVALLTAAIALISYGIGEMGA